jgi:hypothetical protein
MECKSLQSCFGSISSEYQMKGRSLHCRNQDLEILRLKHILFVPSFSKKYAPTASDAVKCIGGVVSYAWFDESLIKKMRHN